MSLSEEVKNYRNWHIASNIKVPRHIIYRWQSHIIPKNYVSLGEKGVDAFIGGRKYSEKTLVHHAIQAEVERCLEMADGFWKRAYALSLEKPKSKSQKTNSSTTSKQLAKPKNIKITGKDKGVLREWWHSILHTHGKYPCYAIVLVLPTDSQTIKYLTEAGREIDLLSKNNCLVMALSDTQAIRYGSDENEWRTAINEQVTNGQSVEIANLFEIKFTEFPCMVIFQDIRSSEHLVISLQKMEIDEISLKMRSFFWAIKSANAKKVNPLIELKTQRRKAEFLRAGQSVISDLRKLGGETIQTIIGAYFQAKFSS